MPASLRRRQRLSITVKLTAIVVVFVLVVAALLGVTTLSLRIYNGARAYVGGEGLWSKGQKDAVYYLTRYALWSDPVDYGRYAAAIQVPLGDHQARLEMEKRVYDEAVVRRGFVQGGNAPEDVPDLIFLFRHFRGVRYLDRAIGIWTEADRGIADLDRCADELHGAIAAGRLSPQHARELLDRIDRINEALAPLERDFSASLGEGSRWLLGTLLTTVLAATALLLAIGIGVAWLIARDLRAGILKLREAALRVSAGDLEHLIPEMRGDELGELAIVFNAMIAHRRAAEEALLSAQQFLAKVMHSTNDAIFAIDLEGRFTLVNRQTTRITGYEEPELLGQPFAPLFAAEDLPRVTAAFESVAHGGREVSNFETPLIRKDGRSIIIAFSDAPLMKDGQVIGVVGSAEDITERKRAETQLARRAEQLARSNEELERFAYVASHDLQEPLRAVASFAQLLGRRFEHDGDVHDYVMHITGETRRMRELIDGLLAYSRLSRDEQPATSQNLETLLQRAQAQLSSAIEESAATVTHDPLPTLPVHATLIVQLLQNLIGNAIKFRGSEAPQIHVSAQPEGEYWRISLQDNGIGIDPQYAERVFMLFQRLHTRDEYPGSGLGLAICRKIVERHGGRIWVEPAAARGSVFHFTLPLAGPPA